MEIFLAQGEREFIVAHILEHYGPLLTEGLIKWAAGDGPYVKLTPKALALIKS